MSEDGRERSASRRRLVLFYPLLFAAVAAIVAVSLSAGSEQAPSP